MQKWRIATALVMACVCSPGEAEQFQLHNQRIFISARINGVPTEALLDSAAEGTLIDPLLAATAQLPAGEPITIRGSGGTAPAHIVEGAQIEALDHVIHPESVVVTDLKDISRRLVRRRVQMVLGRELFDAARLRIDFRARTIGAIAASFTPSGVVLPLHEHAGVESIPVRVDGVVGQAEFDLGNGTDVLISKPFAQSLHLKPTGISVGGGIGGALSRTMVELDRLEIAGVVFHHVRAAIDEQPSANDLNIGTRILRKFLITTDFGNRRIWLKPD